MSHVYFRPVAVFLWLRVSQYGPCMAEQPTLLPHCLSHTADRGRRSLREWRRLPLESFS